MAMEFTRQRIMLYSVVGILVVVLAGVVVYGQLSSRELKTAQDTGISVGGLRSDEAARSFGTQVLQDQRYTSLNRSLLDAGRLPVPPPAARGKPNLFGP